ncbi:MAG: iron ABC transporter permease [Peptococcaceae bacterium]|nr:iron ABC transporter permease [Peptococcaceae bacterium]
MSVLLIILFLFSFSVGRFSIPTKELLDILLSPILNIVPYWEDTLQTVIFDVQLPRIMLAILAGGALSLFGAAYQTLCKNPMASPDLLGVSSGAGFGAALAM